MPLLHRKCKQGCEGRKRGPCPGRSAARAHAWSSSPKAAPAVRCRPGTVTYAVFAAVPDQQRTAPLRVALRRIRDTGLLGDRHRLRHLDTFTADPAAIGDGLDPHAARRVEGGAIGRIDVAGELEAPRRPDLDQG